MVNRALRCSILELCRQAEIIANFATKSAIRLNKLLEAARHFLSIFAIVESRDTEESFAA